MRFCPRQLLPRIGFIANDAPIFSGQFSENNSNFALCKPYLHNTQTNPDSVAYTIYSASLCRSIHVISLLLFALRFSQIHTQMSRSVRVLCEFFFRIVYSPISAPNQFAVVQKGARKSRPLPESGIGGDFIRVFVLFSVSCRHTRNTFDSDIFSGSNAQPFERIVYESDVWRIHAHQPYTHTHTVNPRRAQQAHTYLLCMCAATHQHTSTNTHTRARSYTAYNESGDYINTILCVMKRTASPGHRAVWIAASVCYADRLCLHIANKEMSSNDSVVGLSYCSPRALVCVYELDCMRCSENAANHGEFAIHCSADFELNFRSVFEIRV